MVYDQAYMIRYANYNSRIISQLTKMQEKYLEDFEIWIEYTTPTSFYSYADTNCSTNPTHQCQHSTADDCNNSVLYTNGNINYKTYHHNNYHNIMLRVPLPDTTVSLKLIYSGHDTCRNDNGVHKTNPYYGLAYPNFGMFMVTNNVSVASSTKTTAHEFGHMLGVKDHYTDDLLEQVETSTGLDFDDNCIWGKNKENTEVMNNLTMCEGCKTTIESNKNKYNHG